MVVTKSDSTLPLQKHSSSCLNSLYSKHLTACMTHLNNNEKQFIHWTSLFIYRIYSQRNRSLQILRKYPFHLPQQLPIWPLPKFLVVIHNLPKHIVHHKHYFTFGTLMLDLLHFSTIISWKLRRKTSQAFVQHIDTWRPSFLWKKKFMPLGLLD